MIRSVPLLMRYDDDIYPSLAFEMVRIATQSEQVFVNYDEIGVESIMLSDRNITTDRFGRLYLNYRGPQGSFDYISAADIYQNRFDPKLIEGKFVLIGTSTPGLYDQRATPMDNVMPGVEVHANVIDNLIQGDYLYLPAWIEAADILIILFTALFFALVMAYLSAVWTAVVMLLLFITFYNMYFYLLFSKGIILNLLFPLLTIPIATLLVTLIHYFLESEQKRFIRKKLAKKVSGAVVEDLLKHTSEVVLEGKERETTIFFSDIRKFTELSEKIGSPRRLITILNSYMTPMVEEITKRNGTVDKFIGDAIMAYWNAPNKVALHADLAVQTALIQLEKLNELNKRLDKKHGVQIHIGIGINTGVVTVGEMGSQGRSDYTIIGDPVNLASRLEGLNKQYGTELLISASTREQLKESYTLRLLDLVRVKGKKRPVVIYEVLGRGEPDEELAIELGYYHQAYREYMEKEFERSKELFETLFGEYGNKIYKLYAERSAYYLEHPEIEFDGVFTYNVK